MRVSQLSYRDEIGGAAIAATRIHEAVMSCGAHSTMHVGRRDSEKSTVVERAVRAHKTRTFIRPFMANLTKQLMQTPHPIARSPAMLPSGWPKHLRKVKPDVVHLHWVGNEMLSIEDIPRLPNPVVWTLHDMWAFCGAEHYADSRRWIEGYSRNNRPEYESGIDLNRRVWRRKQRAWKHPFQLIAPSRWLAQCVRNSALLSRWPVTVIPNPLDVGTWTPVDTDVARNVLGLPQEKKIVLFGAFGGLSDPRKGGKLLSESLRLLRRKNIDFAVAIFGQSAFPDGTALQLHADTYYLGRLHDVTTLRLVYSAADVFVAPALQEAFGQTAAESMACGTPVVAFSGTGLADVVEQGTSGLLAEHGDPVSLAAAVEKILQEISDPETAIAIRQRVRKSATQRFSYSAVGNAYMRLYASTIA